MEDIGYMGHETWRCGIWNKGYEVGGVEDIEYAG